MVCLGYGDFFYLEYLHQEYIMIILEEDNTIDGTTRIIGTEQELNGFLEYLKLIEIQYTPGGAFDILLAISPSDVWIKAQIKENYLWINLKLIPHVKAYKEILE